MSTRAKITVIVFALIVLGGSGIMWYLWRSGFFAPQAEVEQTGQLFPSTKIFGLVRANYKNDDCADNYDGDSSNDDSEFYCPTGDQQKKSMSGYFKWVAEHRDMVWTGGRDESFQGDVYKLHDYRRDLGLPDTILNLIYTRPGDDQDTEEFRAGGRAEMLDWAEKNSVDYEDFYIHHGEDARYTGFRSYPHLYPDQLPSVEDRFYYLYEDINPNGKRDDKRFVSREREWYFDQNPITLNASTRDIYLGSFDKFYRLNVIVTKDTTVNVGFDANWQYCSAVDGNGLCAANGWKNLEGTSMFYDQSDHLRANGSWQVGFIPPADWKRAALSTRSEWGHRSQETDRYWYIRFHINATGGGQMPTIKRLASADYIRFIGKDKTYDFTARTQAANQGCEAWPSWDGRQPENFANHPQAACYVVPGWDSRNDVNNDGFIDDQELAILRNPYATARLRKEARAPFSFMDYPSSIRNFSKLNNYFPAYYKQWLNFDQGHGTKYDGFISDNAVSFGDWNGMAVTVNGGQIDPNNGYGLGYFAEYNKNTYPTCETYQLPDPYTRFNNYCTRKAVSGNAQDGDYGNHASGLWDQDYARTMDNLILAVNRDIGRRFFGYNPATGRSDAIERSLDFVLLEANFRSRNSYGEFESQLVPRVADLQQKGKSIVMDTKLEMLDLMGINESAQDKQNPYSPLKAKDKLFTIAQYLLMKGPNDYVGLMSGGGARYDTDTNANTGFDFEKDMWSEALKADLGQPTNTLPAWADAAGAVALPALSSKGVFYFQCKDANGQLQECKNSTGSQSAYRIYGREYEKGIVFLKWGKDSLRAQAGKDSFYDQSADTAHEITTVYRAVGADNQNGRLIESLRKLENFSAVIAQKTDYTFTSDDRLNDKYQRVDDNLLAVELEAGTLSGSRQLTGKPSAVKLTPPEGKQVIANSARELTTSDDTTILGQPITLTFYYSDLSLGGTNPQDLVVGHCRNGTCQTIPTTVDTTAKTLTAQTSELSEFVVLGPGGGGGGGTPPPTPSAGVGSPTPTNTPAPPGVGETPTPSSTPGPAELPGNSPLDSNQPGDLFQNFIREKGKGLPAAATSASRGIQAGVSNVTSLGETGGNALTAALVGIGALLLFLLF